MSHPDPDRLHPSDLALLAVGSASWPLNVMAQNLAALPHPERIVALIAALLATSILVTHGLLRLGADRLTAVRSVFLGFVVALGAGRVFDDSNGAIALLASAGVVVLATVLFSRLRGSLVVGPLIAGLAVAMATGPAVGLITNLGTFGAEETQAPALLDLDLKTTPDIYVVVLDGYPGLLTMQRDFGDSKESFVAALEASGFQVPSSAWSAYPITDLSIPSVLQMSYPVVVPGGGEDIRRELYEIISGTNVLVMALRQAGYTSYMIESGWSGSSCGSSIDQCVVSPLLDEASFLILSGTVVAPFVTAANHPFTAGTENTMSWLMDNAGRLTDDGEPSLVLAHLIAPHPPFYLDKECDRIVDPDRNPPFVTEGTKPFFLEQMGCIDSFMLKLADAVGPETVVVFVADHGTAGRHQMNTEATKWDHDDLAERMNVFTAIKVGDDCDIGDRLLNPNVMRRVLSCLNSGPLPDLGNRMFKPGVIEVAHAEVESLLGDVDP